LTVSANLQSTLVDFLGMAKALLVKSRQVLLTESNSNADAAAATAGGRVAPGETGNALWQTEMEKAYDALLDVISVFVSDIEGADRLRR
jgi:hypothetical protein